MTPAVKRRMAHDAAVLLREAWYMLVAAGYMSDAAEVKAIRERLDSASRVVSPPAREAVHHFRNGQPYDADDMPLPTRPDPGR